MPKTTPFDEYPLRYDDWFERRRFVYDAELRAVQQFVPSSGEGMEIGVGSGRFAQPLGIKTGVEPSQAMRILAQTRGVEPIDAVAEKLPYSDNAFDFVLMVTTICFLDDIGTAFNDAYRVLRPHGALIVGFIDKTSRLGQIYQERHAGHPFYTDATFYSVAEVVHYLENAGFGGFRFCQTIFHDSTRIGPDEPIREGYGEGSFIVLRGLKP